MNKILVYSSPAKPHKIIVFNEDTKEIKEQTNVYPTILAKSKMYDANTVMFLGPQIFTSKLANNLQLAEFAAHSTNNLHIELK